MITAILLELLAAWVKFCWKNDGMEVPVIVINEPCSNNPTVGLEGTFVPAWDTRMHMK